MSPALPTNDVVLMAFPGSRHISRVRRCSCSACRQRLLTRLAAIPLLIDISGAIALTKIPELRPGGFLGVQGFWGMAHDARPDFSMLLGLAAARLRCGSTAPTEPGTPSRPRRSGPGDRHGQAGRSVGAIPEVHCLHRGRARTVTNALAHPGATPPVVVLFFSAARTNSGLVRSGRAARRLPGAQMRCRKHLFCR
jgi:hypothetical protein